MYRIIWHLVKIIWSFAPTKKLAVKICRLYARRHTQKFKPGHNIVFLQDQEGCTGDILYLLSLIENDSGKHNCHIILAPNTQADSIAKLFPALKKSISYWSGRNKHYGKILDRAADITVDSLLPKGSDCFLRGRLSFFSLGLSNDRRLKIERSDKNVFALFHSLSCKRKKTVLICPHAKTTPTSGSIDFWTGYAEELKKRGYVPVFNSSKKFGSFESIFLGYRETVLFAALAGNIIGTRSGLMDILLYFTKSRAIVFYPAEPMLWQEPFISNFWDNPVKRFMEYFSLKKIYPDQDIREYIFSNEYRFWD